MPSQKYDVSTGISARATQDSLVKSQAMLEKVERLIKEGRLARAVVNIKMAMAAGADTYLCTLRLASHFRSVERMNDAMKAAEYATQLYPTRLPGWAILLEFAQETGDMARALSASRTILKLSPRHIPAHVLQASFLMQQGDAPAALKIVNTLIQLDPECPEHHFRKAQISQHLSDVESAIEEFVQVIRIDPEGEFADAARESIESLDMFHLSQIATLASEDAVFRAKLCQNCLEAIREKGYALGPMGERLLADFCRDELQELTFLQSVVRYH